MNWLAISAVAEVVGALAVVATLIYLAIQMKHSTLAVNQAAQQSLVAELGASMDLLFSNPEGAEIWLKGIKSFSSLTAAEKVRFTALLHHYSRTWEHAHLSYRKGTLDAAIWQGLVAQTCDVFGSPGIQEWWRVRGHWYSDEYRSFIESSAKASTKYIESLHSAAQPDRAVAT